MNKAIIFDLEGVIVDTEPLWSKADKMFLLKHGLPSSTYETEWKPKLMGRNLNEGASLFREHYGLLDAVEELARQRREIAKELFAQELNFIKGFKTFFPTVLNKYKTSIATSLERNFLRIVDSKIGLSKLFGVHIYSIEDIGFISKPNPDIFLYAASKLRVHPLNCIVIEDSPHGIDAAKRAGMKCIAITTSSLKERLNKADLVVDSYLEIELDNL